MCMIVYKPFKVNNPQTSLLVRSWSMNEDGAGVSWRKENGKVNFRKGFFTLHSLLEFLEDSEFYNNPTDYEWAIHFRMATHGGRSRFHLHPFNISEDSDIMEVSGEEVDTVFHHNGVLSSSLYTIDHKDARNLSDTMAFAEQYAKIAGADTMRKNAEIIGKGIGYNKFLVMDKDGTFIINKQMGCEVDGVWFSNYIRSHKINYTHNDEFEIF